MADTLAVEAFGDTLVPAGATTTPASAPVDARRSTVLPRVEWAGDQPKLHPGERPRFEEVGHLGSGGMGEVALVRDHDIERTVAVKRLTAASDVGAVLRFVEEIRIVGQLEHPNIVPVHDVGLDANGRYFFVMKHVRGETLEAIVTRLKAGDPETHAKYPMQARVQIFIGLLNAMAYAHREGFIHRDLKPANVMVGPFGEVTVMDWGLAKRIHGGRSPVEPSPEEMCAAPVTPAPVAAPLDPSISGPRLMTMVGSIMGTPAFMSPEQARGEHDKLDERSDLYSLGVMFHELLTLEHYLAGRSGLNEVLEGVQQVMPPVHHSALRDVQGPVPAELDWYVQRAMQKDCAQRFQSAEAMQAELQRVMSGTFRVQCQITFTKRVLSLLSHQADKHPLVVIIGSTGAASLILAALVKSALTLFG